MNNQDVDLLDTVLNNKSDAITVEDQKAQEMLCFDETAIDRNPLEFNVQSESNNDLEEF